jgi:hypothetical protein
VSKDPRLAGNTIGGDLKDYQLIGLGFFLGVVTLTICLILIERWKDGKNP